MANQGNRIVYFRQDDWQTLCRPIIDDLAKKVFTKCSIVSVDRSHLPRFLIKIVLSARCRSVAVREQVGILLCSPPTERNWRATYYQSEAEDAHGTLLISLWMLLKLCLVLDCSWSEGCICQLAAQEHFRDSRLRKGSSDAWSIFDGVRSVRQEQNSALLGSSCFGRDDIYLKLATYKNRFRGDSRSLSVPQPWHCVRVLILFFSPRLYFVKADVKSCYDTIKQDKLLQLIKTILSQVNCGSRCGGAI